MEKQVTPPPCGPETDGSAEARLLQAISRNPDTAHALAAIAEGADPKEVLADLLPKEEKSEQEPEEAAAPESAESIPVGSPAFLEGSCSDFWDGLA